MTHLFQTHMLTRIMHAHTHTQLLLLLEKVLFYCYFFAFKPVILTDTYSECHVDVLMPLN